MSILERPLGFTLHAQIDTVVSVFLEQRRSASVATHRHLNIPGAFLAGIASFQTLREQFLGADVVRVVTRGIPPSVFLVIFEEELYYVPDFRCGITHP